MFGYFVVAFLIAILGATVSAGEDGRLERADYARFVKLSGGDERNHIVDLEAEPDEKLLLNYITNRNSNTYILFTRNKQAALSVNSFYVTFHSYEFIKTGFRKIWPKKNPKDGLILTEDDFNSVASSNFDINNSIIVIVHGWLGNKQSGLNSAIRDAYLNKGDTNVIVMDWSPLSMSDYVTATRGVPATGVKLGQFMNYLHTQVTGAPYESMHLVGFSLGAHIVGNAGRTMGGKAARVTGLDPAGPLWYNSDDRLRYSDGVYVEVIHTDGGRIMRGLGLRTAVAHVDFFPNGGKTQPGCVTDLCNHNRSWQLFAATVAYNHLVGQKCSSKRSLVWDNCTGDKLHMGNDFLNKTGSGTYRLDTGRSYPF